MKLFVSTEKSFNPTYAIDDVRMEEIEGQKITGARQQCHVHDGRSLKKAGCLPDCWEF